MAHVSTWMRQTRDAQQGSAGFMKYILIPQTWMTKKKDNANPSALNSASGAPIPAAPRPLEQIHRVHKHRQLDERADSCWQSARPLRAPYVAAAAAMAKGSKVVAGRSETLRARTTR